MLDENGTVTAPTPATPATPIADYVEGFLKRGEMPPAGDYAIERTLVL